MKRQSSTSTPPESDVTFFADRNLGKTFVEILRKGGLNVEAHSDHFPEHEWEPERDDCGWIRLCAQRSWVIISGDKNIARNFPEIEEVMTSGAEMFVPEGKKHPTVFANLMLRTQARIFRHIKNKRK